MVLNVVVVVIGRNEGVRLQRCLTKLKMESQADIVYVDSGSTDESVAFALGLGIAVVKLESDQPYTAARARNAGFDYARQHLPHAHYVQFMDGDCELAASWLSLAVHTLDSQPRVAVVCGRRRERYPELTVYNKLCDIEWDTPCGETETCGGDAMMRMSALQDIGGFRASLIAGEEPELCLRLRQRGWKVLRMDAEMTVHDADMRSFGQWWRRAQRSGFALAEGLWLHGGMPERYCWRETFSALLWGLLVPVLIFVCALKSLAMALLLAIVYPLQAMRIGLRRGLTYGIFCLVQKFAETVGVSQFILRKLLDRPVALIEYK